MSKIKKFRDYEDDEDFVEEIINEREKNNPGFRRMVEDAAKRRQLERRNRRREKRSYLDEED